MQIDHDIPIPDATRRNKYPWPEMGVGDSFFVAVERERLSSRQSSIAAAGKNWGRKHGCDFIVRRVDGGLRIWRTK